MIKKHNAIEIYQVREYIVASKVSFAYKKSEKYVIVLNEILQIRLTTLQQRLQ
jgi:hypothetical protein